MSLELGKVFWSKSLRLKRYEISVFFPLSIAIASGRQEVLVDFKQLNIYTLNGMAIIKQSWQKNKDSSGSFTYLNVY